MSERERLPSGWFFFRPGCPSAYRRRRLTFVALVALATAALIWPLYAFFGSPVPRILGLPLSLAWVIFWLLAIFVGLVWLYRTEPSEDGALDHGSSGEGPPADRAPAGGTPDGAEP